MDKNKKFPLIDTKRYVTTTRKVRVVKWAPVKPQREGQIQYFESLNSLRGGGGGGGGEVELVHTSENLGLRDLQHGISKRKISTDSPKGKDLSLCTEKKGGTVLKLLLSAHEEDMHLT